MVTYSDLVTLLLVFFVLLFSFSSIDVAKLKAFVASFQGVGILDWGPQPFQEVQEMDSLTDTSDSMSTQLPQPQNISSAESFTEVYAMVNSYIDENKLSNVVEVSLQERGVALDIKEKILFDTGKAELKPEAEEVLDKLSDLFAKLPYEISVEGHTDERPIHTAQFPTNWELSTARAARVVRYFIEDHRLDPLKFAAVGFGQYRPVAPNDSLENMALNRRVVLVINAKNIYQDTEVNLDGYTGGRN